MPQEVVRRLSRAVCAGASALLLLTVARAVSAQGTDGAALYAATCKACHQASGLGLPGQFPPLAGSEWVTGSEERLVRIILHGILGEIEVEGETFNGAMPTWGPTFKDEDVAAVATYVRTTWGNKASPITTATVTRVRLKYSARTTPWTAAELQRSSPLSLSEALPPRHQRTTSHR